MKKCNARTAMKSCRGGIKTYACHIFCHSPFTMFGLLFVVTALTDDLCWWFTMRKLKRETREAAARLVLILQEEFEET